MKSVLEWRWDGMATNWRVSTTNERISAASILGTPWFHCLAQMEMRSVLVILKATEWNA